jgi:ABC-type multidrug transport system fused ATPase/permease subunit
VALVGHSGAGKTTIVKLLLRLADIQGGSITIDGQDITNVTQDALRRRIAYVPQEPYLFHRTLRENIAYAKPEATLEEVQNVARRAHAHEFIESLPRGYDTLVGERGIKLSGGERQRVAIARAMLKDAPVLILDEATSSLDSISESYIQAAFDELMAGKTTIVIAHRLSTIQRMDRIIVFEDGAVVEEGSHKELLQKEGVYAELWKSQVGGFIGD